MESVLALDLEAFYLINHGWASPFLDVVMPWITKLKHFVPAIVLLVAWLLWKGGRRGRVAVLAVALSVAISDPLTVRVLKPAFDRDRPCIAVEDTRLLASRKSSRSFPSAHAVNTFAVATIFFAFYRRSAYVGYPFATAVSLSRVYIGVHYPSDILVGAVLGVGIGASVVAGLRVTGRRVRALRVEDPAPGAPPTPTSDRSGAPA